MFSTRHPRLIADRGFSRLLTSALGLLAACSGTDSTSPPPAPQFTIVAQPTATDSIQARPAQALVLELRGSDGRPRPRTTVRFSVLPTTDPKRLTELGAGLSSISGSTYGTFIADSTDTEGRVKVLVAFGTVAGPAGIVAHVPELGIIDTFKMTVRPGAGSALLLPVRDTVVAIGARYSIGATVVDRFKNSIADEALTFSAGSAGLSVDAAGTVTITGTGRMYVVVKSKSFSDTSRASGVPSLRIAFYRAGKLGTANLDGTGMTTLVSSGDASTFPHAAPGGQLIAYYEHNPNSNSTLSVVSSNGVARQIASDGGPAWPRWSSDGQWIYFTAVRTNGVGVSRIRPDGSGVQTIGPVFASFGFSSVGISPDGRTLVVNDQGSLMLIDITSGSTQRFTTAASCSMPQFSPDGQRIACLTESSIRIINRDGSGERVVANRVAQLAGGVDWSSDGAWLLTSGGSAPELISVADGTAMVLTKFGAIPLAQASFIP